MENDSAPEFDNTPEFDNSGEHICEQGSFEENQSSAQDSELSQDQIIAQYEGLVRQYESQAPEQIPETPPLPQEHQEPEKKPEKNYIWKSIKCHLVAGAMIGAGILGLWGFHDFVSNNSLTTRNLMQSAGIAAYQFKSENPASPYGFSPWEKYATLEEKLLDDLEIPEEDIPRKTDEILNFADHLSSRVAGRVLAQYPTFSIDKAVQKTSRTKLLETIADEMANQGIFYTKESLLSNSFNENMHSEGKKHLDCDLLAYLFMHVGGDLGIDMHAASNYSHLYFTADAGDGKGSFYVMEPTEFRNKERHEGYINLAGKGIGKDFFSNWEKQRTRGKVRATEELEESAKMNRRVKDPVMVEDGIFANIIAGLMDYAESKEDLDLEKRIYDKVDERMDDKITHHEDGTQSLDCDNYLLASNYYAISMNLGRESLKSFEPGKAERYFKNATWIRSVRNDLIIDQEPIEQGLLGIAYVEQGKHQEALEQLRIAKDAYEEKGMGYLYGDEDLPTTRNSDHSKTLLALAEEELRVGTMSKLEIREQLLDPVRRLYEVNDWTDRLEFKELESLEGRTMYASARDRHHPESYYDSLNTDEEIDSYFESRDDDYINSLIEKQAALKELRSALKEYKKSMKEYRDLQNNSDY